MGIVIGVVTLTGVGFKLSTIITGAAQAVAGGAADFLPAMLADTKTLTLLVALVMTGLVCILLGCGIPTTANYIIMVTVAAPTLVLLGVQPLVAHFFVFYYGVLADITPPVALAAYAAAGMAGSDPFKTGNMAFRLGLAKALVPFVFVFSPSLLLVAKGFTLVRLRGHLRRLRGRHHAAGRGVVEVHVDRVAALGAGACWPRRAAVGRTRPGERPDRRWRSPRRCCCGNGHAGRARPPPACCLAAADRAAARAAASGPLSEAVRCPGLRGRSPAGGPTSRRPAPAPSRRPVPSRWSRGRG